MEADWEVELDTNSRVIDAHWPEFVDLRKSPQLVGTLSEVADFPALADALVRLNARSSPFWTTKCDVWHVDTSDAHLFDPYELDASPETAVHAMATYIDLLAASDSVWPAPESAIRWCRQVSKLLHLIPMSCCRADLILRRAHLAREDRTVLGVTAYLSACGATPSNAASVLASILRVFVNSVLAIGTETSTTASDDESS